MRILVVGAGAIGGIVGGYLSQGSNAVILADRFADHVQAMNENGLLISGVRGDVRFDVTACLPEDLDGTFDVVFMAVKSQHTRDALATIERHIHADSAVVSLQNGLANKTLLTETVGLERAVGAMVRLSAGFSGPGHVVQQSEGLFVVGRVDGAITDKVNNVQQLLASVASAEASDNLYGWLWAKEMYNSFGLVCTVAGATKKEMLAVPRSDDLVIEIMREYASVAMAESISLNSFSYFDPRPLTDNDAAPFDSVRRDLQSIAEQFGDTRGGIYRDIVVRKIPIELEYTAGEIARLGDRHGVDTPILDRTIEMIYQIEAGDREISFDNVQELIDRV